MKLTNLIFDIPPPNDLFKLLWPEKVLQLNHVQRESKQSPSTELNQVTLTFQVHRMDSSLYLRKKKLQVDNKYISSWNWKGKKK